MDPFDQDYHKTITCAHCGAKCLLRESYYCRTISQPCCSTLCAFLDAFELTSAPVGSPRFRSDTEPAPAPSGLSVCAFCSAEATTLYGADPACVYCKHRKSITTKEYYSFRGQLDQRIAEAKKPDEPVECAWMTPSWEEL